MADSKEEIEKTLGIGATSVRVPGWAWAVGGVVAAALGLGAWSYLGSGGTAARYVTAPVERSDIRVIVTATGTVEPTNVVEISSELSGTLESVNFDFNDRVEEGAVLAELDTTKLEAQLAVARAALDSAIARVAVAEATVDETRERYENARRLEERGVTAHQAFIEERAAFVRAQAQVQAAKAERALAEADVDLHRAELEKACICSPITGVVLDRAVDPGQIVAATLSAPVLFKVAEDLTMMELQVDIDEADIGRAALGQPAEFTVDAYDERVFPAEIAEIRFAPRTVDGVVTYKAILSIDNSDMALRPGMTATADIVVAEITDTLSVPNAALRYAPPLPPEERDERSGLLGMLLPQDDERVLRADPGTVWVMRGAEPVEVAVRPGASDGRRTEILEGDLEPGDRVVIEQSGG